MLTQWWTGDLTQFYNQNLEGYYLAGGSRLRDEISDLNAGKTVPAGDQQTIIIKDYFETALGLERRRNEKIH